MECIVTSLGCLALIPVLYIVVDAVLYRQLIQPYMRQRQLTHFNSRPGPSLQAWMLQLALLGAILFAIAMVIGGGSGRQF